MDIINYNSAAWDNQVRAGNQWTIPVGPEPIARARQGSVDIVLTPQRHVPADWLGDLAGQRVLCLASGGGQQAPLLAAAGADVTVLDNSAAQLQQDRAVAQREGLQLQTDQGDMRDLSRYAPESFDLIVHPCSNSFVPDVLPVWQQAARVLRSGGTLLSGFCNPLLFLFDYEALLKGELRVVYPIPYSDQDLPADQLQQLVNDNEPLCFGHTLQDQIGGQTDVGLAVTGFYEDTWPEDTAYALLSKYISAFAATRSLKL